MNKRQGNLKLLNKYLFYFSKLNQNKIKMTFLLNILT